MCGYVCVGIYVCVYICMGIYVCVRVGMYVWVCVCGYFCVCACVYVTHTHIILTTRKKLHDKVKINGILE